ncbi:MAG: protoporphyrinogen oxidase-like protein [bacterium]
MPIIILGAGPAGLAAGSVSGFTIIEKNNIAGGLCTTYYLSPGQPRTERRSSSEQEYRFEIAGGHWLSISDTKILRYLRAFVPLTAYDRRAGVYLTRQQCVIPYPIQHHLHMLGRNIKDRIDGEIRLPWNEPASTLKEWLTLTFGETLGELFFAPYHRLCTAGLWESIAPQDFYKTPVERGEILPDRKSAGRKIGYHSMFAYPDYGFDDLFRRLAAQCYLKTSCPVVRIILTAKEIELAEGTIQPYSKIISSLPLHFMVKATGLSTESPPDPHTSLLLLNVGARKGERCPLEHWLYVPESKTGIHRVGFYSNVDERFLPKQHRGKGTHVSLYVEKSFPSVIELTSRQIDDECNTIIHELQDWEFIGECEIADPHWIPMAYAWRYPGSVWVEEVGTKLASHQIYLAGRNARWNCQGTVASIRDGLELGVLHSSSHVQFSLLNQ